MIEFKSWIRRFIIMKELIITRIFNAPGKLVWKAWTEPEYVKHWWGPKGFTCPVAKIDFELAASISFA
jgi:uncharacterized protein YndB with AHSA1/START domain